MEYFRFLAEYLELYVEFPETEISGDFTWYLYQALSYLTSHKLLAYADWKFFFLKQGELGENQSFVIARSALSLFQAHEFFDPIELQEVSCSRTSFISFIHSLINDSNAQNRFALEVGQKEDLQIIKIMGMIVILFADPIETQQVFCSLTSFISFIH